LIEVHSSINKIAVNGVQFLPIHNSFPLDETLEYECTWWTGERPFAH